MKTIAEQRGINLRTQLTATFREFRQADSDAQRLQSKLRILELCARMQQLKMTDIPKIPDDIAKGA